MTKKGPVSKSDGKQSGMGNKFEKTAAIYVRKSNDPNDTAEKSMADQKADCEKFAKANGFKIVADYSEIVSVSKYSNKKAKQFQKAMAEMGTKYHTLIAWELTRATRKDSLDLEFNTVISNVVESGGRLVSLCGFVDTDKLGEMTERIKLAIGREFAAAESDKISERVSRGMNGLALANKWTGGWTPYGLDVGINHLGDRDAVANQEEIEVFKEMIEWVIKGATTSEIATDLNSRGVTTKRNSKWTSSAVTRLFTHGRHWVGHRTHRGETSCDEHGEPFIAPHGQLVDTAKFYAAKEIIKARNLKHQGNSKRGTYKQRGKTLLASLTMCDVCDMWMNSNNSGGLYTTAAGEVKERKARYAGCQACRPRNSVRTDILYPLVVQKALVHLAQQNPTSEMMTEVARNWLHQHDIGSIRMKKNLAGDAAQLQERKKELLELFTDGMITKDQFKEKAIDIDAKLVGIEAELAACPPEEIDITPLLDLISCSDGESLTGEGSAWSQLPLHQQRVIMNTIIDEVRISKPEGATPSSHMEERVKIIFNKDSVAVEQACRADIWVNKNRRVHYEKGRESLRENSMS
tara:strand:+ start:391 stop:2121 length:1731 start_codon:yes stop_codon:yes gene_type:complete